MQDPGLDRLLENARWVRALGVELAGGLEADDLAQEAWLVALARREPVREPAAWLAGVVRRLAGRARRTGERRTRREAAVARAEAQPGADELVAEAELSRALIRAVTELDEPFRTTVLLRFYRGWTPEEIAASQGVPGATVRTRLHRALARLRERFDREQGGRSSWALAFVRPEVLATAGGAGSTIGTIGTGGGALMGAKAWLGAAAAVAVVAGYAWLSDVEERELVSARVEGGSGVADRTAEAVSAPSGSGPPTSVRETLAPVPKAAVADVLLYGSTTDPAGRPVVLEWIKVEDAQGVVRDVSRLDAGSYALAGLAPGRCTLRARAVGFVSVREELELDAEQVRRDLVLAPGLSIPVKIVDESGAPWKEEPDPSVQDALQVVVTRAEPRDGLSGPVRSLAPLHGAGEYVSAGNDDAHVVPRGASGLLRTSAPLPLFVSLILRDATLETRRIDGPLSELVFTLSHAGLAARRGGVRARFVDAVTGAPLTGALVQLDPPQVVSHGGGVPVDARGAVLLEGFAPGLHRLRVTQAEHADVGRNVRVPDGRVEDLGDVPVWPRSVIHGTVLDASGQPLRAFLRATPLGEAVGPALDIGTRNVTRGGAFELDPVARAPLWLVVEAPGHAPLARMVDASGPVEDLVLTLAEGVPVVLRASPSWIGKQVTLADEQGLALQSWTLGDAALTTRLTPGRYQLWLGWAERVDEVRELVVGESAVVIELGR